MSESYLPVTKVSFDGKLMIVYPDFLSDALVKHDETVLGQVYECQGCGGLVTDVSLHESHHRQLDNMQRQIDEASRE